jgi:hypothetical protein
VLASGSTALESMIATAYIELQDVPVHQGGPTAIDVIELMLTFGFVPIARDNQDPAAHNALFLHRDLLPVVVGDITQFLITEHASRRSPSQL